MKSSFPYSLLFLQLHISLLSSAFHSSIFARLIKKNYIWSSREEIEENMNQNNGQQIFVVDGSLSQPVNSGLASTPDGNVRRRIKVSITTNTASCRVIWSEHNRNEMFLSVENKSEGSVCGKKWKTRSRRKLFVRTSQKFDKLSSLFMFFRSASRFKIFRFDLCYKTRFWETPPKICLSFA